VKAGEPGALTVLDHNHTRAYCSESTW